jgi:hypothetical protein
VDNNFNNYNKTTATTATATTSSFSSKFDEEENLNFFYKKNTF